MLARVLKLVKINKNSLNFHIDLIFFMAGIAPVIGLLGTIDGVMYIFQNIADMGIVSAVSMSAGIGKALITTQVGLVIAIPGLAIGNYFDDKLIRSWKVCKGEGKMARKRENKDIVNNLNITPLLDMVFILLIFFVVTSNFVQHKIIDIDLPSAVTGKELKEKDFHLLSLTLDGEILFDEKKTDFENLNSFLKGRDVKKVMIATDKGVASGKLIKAMDFLRKNNIYDIGVFVRKS